MSADMQCPYCGADQEVCHDDGRGYSEDENHEHICSECEKTFVFRTFIYFNYEASKADCLNDGEHNLKMTNTYPKRFSMMRCKDCDYQRNPTNDEWIANGITADDIAKE